jgi:hypothetical protein
MSNNLIESLRMENASLSQLYKNSLSKMKAMQDEYEALYLNYIKENQLRENNIKNNYFKYQNLLQQNFQNEENNYLEEIKNLKLEINEKNKIINILQKNNSQLKEKLSRNELIYHLKEKEYQEELLKKDRQLMKSSELVKKNSKEVMEDIQKLKTELKYFQNKIYMINNDKDLNNNNTNTNTITNLKSTFFSQDSNFNKLKKSPSSNNVNRLLCCCDCHKNDFDKSFYSAKFSNLNNGSLNEIVILRNKIKYLNGIIKKKDEEITFWKNLRKNICNTNNESPVPNIKNIINKLNMNKNSQKNFQVRNGVRHLSQTSSHFRPYHKNLNLNLVNSNDNNQINI